MCVKKASRTWVLALLVGMQPMWAAADGLPPFDADYLDPDPAAQRLERVDPDSEGARDALEAGLRRDPRNPLLRVQHAQLLLDRGLRARVGRELVAAERASAVDSLTRRSVQFNSGWVLYRMGDFQAARRQWTQAWQGHGGQPDWVPVAFALALWNEGDRETGLAYFRTEHRLRRAQWEGPEAFAATTAAFSDSERFALASMLQRLGQAP